MIKVFKIKPVYGESFLVQKVGNNFGRIDEDQFIANVLAPHTSQYFFAEITQSTIADDETLTDEAAIRLLNRVLLCETIPAVGVIHEQAGPLARAFTDLYNYATLALDEEDYNDLH